MKTSTGTTNDMFKAHFHFATFPALGENFFRLLMRWRCILESIHENLSSKRKPNKRNQQVNEVSQNRFNFIISNKTIIRPTNERWHLGCSDNIESEYLKSCIQSLICLCEAEANHNIMKIRSDEIPG